MNAHPSSKGDLLRNAGSSHHDSGGCDAITPEAVRVALHAILATDAFRRSERCSRLLQALVEYTLAGHAGEQKEYSLGVEVFDRKPSFDPRVDPIVRVEVGRLRRKLEEYYENEGRDRSVRILVPLRQHAAVFTRQAPAQPASPPPAPVASAPVAPKLLAKKSILLFVSALLVVAVAIVGVNWPASGVRTASADEASFAVLPLLDLSPGASLASFSDALTAEIIEALGNARGFRVVSQQSSFSLKGTNQDVTEIGRRLRVRYILEGSVNRVGERVRVIVRLVNAADGYRLWSRSFVHELDGAHAVVERIAHSIVDELRQHLGESAGSQ